MNPPNRLTQLAANMRTAMAIPAPNVFRTANLARGLEITLGRQGDRWRLTLSRPDVYPSQREVEICAAAFAAPAGVEPAHRITHDFTTGRRRTLNTVALAWTELGTDAN